MRFNNNVCSIRASFTFPVIFQSYTDLEKSSGIFLSLITSSSFNLRVPILVTIQFSSFSFLYLQIWRIFTTFLFFGTFGFNFFFNMIFTYRYCRMLEENSFRGHTADFVVMFLFGSCSMVIFALFVNLLFLGKFITKLFISFKHHLSSTYPIQNIQIVCFISQFQGKHLQLC